MKWRENRDTNVDNGISEAGPIAGAGNEAKGVDDDKVRKGNDLERESTLEVSKEKGSGEPADEMEVGMTVEEAKSALKQLQKLTKPNQEQFQV